MDRDRGALRRLEAMVPATHHPCDRSELGHQIKNYRTRIEKAENRLNTLMSFIIINAIINGYYHF